MHGTIEKKRKENVNRKEDKIEISISEKCLDVVISKIKVQISKETIYLKAMMINSTQENWSIQECMYQNFRDSLLINVSRKKMNK